MYCSDEVIKKGHSLLIAMEEQLSKQTIDQQLLINLKGELVLAIRRDLLSSRKVIKWRKTSKITSLEPKHFLDIKFNRKPKTEGQRQQNK